ncbi:Spx/MgsR family RNA polymerase-binding regulatory protein [Salinicoccus cyprini]|uniref:Spx/MgsR family RNA polymerase-binding regulatory protein n=1 Tax=Salinicoccus cyprini TaxID=2493691 RepID=A0A558AWR6_9STAP|nr:Spx/MgsR family RNA polymerase-binding regulatory protein [Salinicoccus cyprini]TVT28708.1 Spx/MgsR family RNA polymerase-binding regulatory protein [Salinicoccus cyprini]
MITFYEYPKCTTCRKGKKFLQDSGVEFDSVDMVKSPPSAEVLRELLETSGTDIDMLFNKRGRKYKDLDLNDRLDDMSRDEKLALLSSDGMLIKRPLLYDGTSVLLGFKEAEYRKLVSS